MAITGSTDLGRGVLALTVDADPSTTAVNAPNGSLIIYNGIWYRKLDNGSSTNVSGGTKYAMSLGGKLPTSSLPLINIGIEISSGTSVATKFRARRGTAGTTGTTTIQLEVNGAAIAGATLSWVAGTDANFALKTVTISQIMSVGDRVSFRLTASETNAEDIYAEVD